MICLNNAIYLVKNFFQIQER